MPKGKNTAAKLDAKKITKSKVVSKSMKKTAPAKGGIKPPKAGSSQGAERKKTRFKPGTVVLREIKKYQKLTSLLLLRAPF